MNKPCEEKINRIKNHAPFGVALNNFAEYVELLNTGPEPAFTGTISVQNAHTISVFIKNIGSGTALARLQNSPDGLNYINDVQTLELKAGETGFLIPVIFSKYMRLAVTGSETGRIQVWFQTQRLCYWEKRALSGP